ncbi:MAG: hypothetical protein H6Q73_4482 [Firmicutes bacterium]|nr:hypothetical protein [Bacillota bacterium]
MRSVNPARIEELVAKVGLCAGDIVLDVGWGTGILEPYIKQLIGDQGGITAVDFAENMIARAIDKYRNLEGINFLAMDIMDFEDRVQLSSQK